MTNLEFGQRVVLIDPLFFRDEEKATAVIQILGGRSFATSALTLRSIC